MKAVLPIVLAAMAIVVYVNALHSPFVYDDRTEIVENLAIRRLPDVRAVVQASPTRPILTLTYAVNYTIGRLDPFGYHLTNLALHSVNVLLLFWLVLGLGNGPPSERGAARAALLPAFAAAGLLAVHPLMTEAVGYVSGRSELLSGVFFLSALLCFRRAFTGQDRWYLPALTCFVAGLFTKETTVMLPVVLMAYDRLLIRPSPDAWRRRVWGLYVPLLSFVAFAGAARVWLYQAIEVPKAAGIDWHNGLVELHVLVRYLGLLVYPASQSIIQPVYLIASVTDTRVLIAVCILAAVAALGILARQRLPAVTVGLIWFFALLLPSASLIVLAAFGEPMSEHRAYVASAGFFVAITAPLGRVAVLSDRRRFSALVGGIAIVLAVLAGTAIARNRVWQTPVRLWVDAANKAPQTWMAVYAMADAYRATGDHLRAVEGYRRALRLRTADPNAYIPLADSLLQLGRLEPAREALREAVTKNPSNVQLLLARASLEEGAHDRVVALQMCQQAVALDPTNQDAIACVQRTAPR